MMSHTPQRKELNSLGLGYTSNLIINITCTICLLFINVILFL